MLCICLSCCAPSRRAHAALGSPAPIQHLLSLPAPTLQHWGLWMGDAWSSRFICFNHYFMIWSVLFWVSKSYSRRESPQAWHSVGMLHWCFAFRPHTRAHTLGAVSSLFTRGQTGITKLRDKSAARHSFVFMTCSVSESCLYHYTTI